MSYNRSRVQHLDFFGDNILVRHKWNLAFARCKRSGGKRLTAGGPGKVSISCVTWCLIACLTPLGQTMSGYRERNVWYTLVIISSDVSLSIFTGLPMAQSDVCRSQMIVGCQRAIQKNLANLLLLWACQHQQM